MVATRVLFLCTGNSARSIMAEAILNQDGKGRFEAVSAGTDPAEQVSLLALSTLERYGYPTEGLKSKSWEVFASKDAPPFNYFITVCSRAREEVCPLWQGGGVQLHWSVTDPLLVEGNQARMQASFDEVFAVLKGYVGEFLKKDSTTTD